MKVFVDTNIFLDFALDRDKADEAEQILRAVIDGQFKGYVADISLINIAYIARKQHSSVEKLLQVMINHYTILGADNKLFRQAISLDNSDLEDNVQLLLADQASCKIIITNDLGFPNENIPVLSSSEFVKHHCL